jgi:transposase
MAYSLDYRERAMELLEEGKSQTEVSELLGVGRKTVGAWKKREEAGILGTNYPAKRGAYRIDEAALKAHLEEHPDAYLSELAEVAGGTAQGVRHALKRMGITRKKRHLSIESGMRLNGKAI